MDFGRISRRHLLQGGAALTLGSAFGARSAQAKTDVTVGFIYVGPGRLRLQPGPRRGSQGAQIVARRQGREEENVPETVAVQKTMESMINLDGAKLLFPTSFGYFDPHI